MNDTYTPHNLAGSYVTLASGSVAEIVHNLDGSADAVLIHTDGDPGHPGNVVTLAAAQDI